MLDSLFTRFSRIDERPVEEIDRDIDDELTTHISLLEADLIESGLSPAAARETAISRFGNPEIHKRHCRDVALQERRMKSVIQIAIPTVCCLMLAAVTTSIWFNQQSANASLATMNQRMDDLNRSLSARSPQPNVAPPSDFGRSVYITGTPVSRPGQYNVPAEGLSLRRLLAASGVNLKFVSDIDVRHSNKYGQPGNERLSAAAILDTAGPDIELRADDLVTVFEAKP